MDQSECSRRHASYLCYIIIDTLKEYKIRPYKIKILYGSKKNIKNKYAFKKDININDLYYIIK